MKYHPRLYFFHFFSHTDIYVMFITKVEGRDIQVNICHCCGELTSVTLDAGNLLTGVTSVMAVTPISNNVIKLDIHSYF